jgi:dimethylargininase
VDLALARAQHGAYEHALARLGARVVRLNAPPDLPDAPFIEDVLAVMHGVALLCRPGAETRRPELEGLRSAVAPHLGSDVAWIDVPEGVTLDGGDLLCWDAEIRVGVGGRTSPGAVGALQSVFGPRGFRVRGIALNGALHLKTAMTSPEPGLAVANLGWLDLEAGLLAPDGVWRAEREAFSGLELRPTLPDEPFGGNLLALGGGVLVPEEHPATARLLEEAGLVPEPLAVSEFLKAEAGVTCLSVVVSGAGD